MRVGWQAGLEPIPGRVTYRPSTPGWPTMPETLDALPAFENLLCGRRLQYERKYATAPRMIFNPYFSVMRFDNRLANRQAEPDSLSRHHFPLLYLMELAKDFAFMPVGDARTAVRNCRKDRSVRAFANTSDDLAVIW